MKNLSKAIALVGAMTASTAAFAEGHEGHAVEVSASAGVATSYLFRGGEVGSGSPMVYGDLTASVAGAYASVWIAGGDTVNETSGDDFGSTEYDLIVGYGGEAGDFSYDINLTNYVYTGAAEDDKPFDSTEAILSLGYGDFGVSYVTSVTASDAADYYTASYGAGDFGFTVGKFEDGYTHLDVSYAATENITIIASQLVESEDTDEDDLILVVDVALPL